MLLVSSYLPELLGLCDRIAVMRRGRLGPPRAGARSAPSISSMMEATGGRGRGVNDAALIDTGGPLLGLLFVAILFGALIGPRFFSGANLELIARQTAIVCTAALGMTMIIVSGGIDLSVGSVVALTTVVVAVLLRADAGPARPRWRALPPRPCAAWLNGVLITALRVIPFIVTLGMMILVRGAAKGLADERRIEAPPTWLNDLLRTVDPDSALLVPPGIWLVALLALLVAGTLGYTRFGRHLFSIGSNERTARLCGVAVERTKIAVYTRRATLAGVAGRAPVLALVGRRSDSGRRPRARRDCRRHHRRRQPHRRPRIRAGNRPRRIDDGCHPDRLLPAAACRTGFSRSSREASSSWRWRWITGEPAWRERSEAAMHHDSTVSTYGSPRRARAPGTDAMHTDPDYSAAYVILRTDTASRDTASTFTIGRGNEVCALAIDAFRPLVVGRRLEDITSDFAGFWRLLAGDSQLRWLGPEKGVIHLALAAIVNASGTCTRRRSASRSGSCSSDMTPRADRVVHRFSLHHRRAHA